MHPPGNWSESHSATARSPSGWLRCRAFPRDSGPRPRWWSAGPSTSRPLVFGIPDGVPSTEAETRIRKHLPWLVETLPGLRVVTLNIQPAHAAVLEGEREVVLTGEATLPMQVNGITLHLGLRSFFQTNTDVAAALYRTARAWVDELAPTSVFDLYCGVGGFALHLAAPGRAVTGIEISADAVTAAERGRDGASLS